MGAVHLRGRPKAKDNLKTDPRVCLSRYFNRFISRESFESRDDVEAKRVAGTGLIVVFLAALFRKRKTPTENTAEQ